MIHACFGEIIAQRSNDVMWSYLSTLHLILRIAGHRSSWSHFIDFSQQQSLPLESIEQIRCHPVLKFPMFRGQLWLPRKIICIVFLVTIYLSLFNDPFDFCIFCDWLEISGRSFLDISPSSWSPTNDSPQTSVALHLSHWLSIGRPYVYC